MKSTSSDQLSYIQTLSIESMSILTEVDLDDLYSEIKEYFDDSEIGIQLDQVSFRNLPMPEKIKLIHYLLNKNIPGWFSTVARSIWKLFIFEFIGLPSSVYNIRSTFYNYILSYFRNKTFDEIHQETKSRYGSKQLMWMKIFALAFQLIAGITVMKYSSSSTNQKSPLIFIGFFLIALLANPFTYMIIKSNNNRKQEFIDKVVSIYKRAWNRMKTSEENKNKQVVLSTTFKSGENKRNRQTMKANYKKKIFRKKTAVGRQ